jgi:Domain of unknown function (DUF4386)
MKHRPNPSTGSSQGQEMSPGGSTSPEGTFGQPRSAEPSPREQSEVILGDRALFRLGSVLGVLGVVLVVLMEGFLHPNRAHPNDSPAAFREYAASDSFTSIHIGDFVGTLCIVIALVALYRSVAAQGSWVRACATVGVIAAVVVAAVFAVQMAVDGVALKSAVDKWVSAPAAEKPAAFRVADGIRDVEKGLSGFFQISNGIALLGLGLAVAMARGHPRWLGVVGALAGIGSLVGGWTTAHTGFSMAASRFSLPTVALLAVFVLGLSAFLWRRSSADRELD